MAKDFGTFVECDKCSAKLGSPILCNACLHNRRVIESQAQRLQALQSQIGALTENLSRLAEIAQFGQGYDGEGHYGPYGNHCMNIGQFDAGECWLCYMKRQKDRIKVLEDRIGALNEGECRFNCRSQRAMFIIGYREAIANQDIEGDIRVTPEQAYDEWGAESD